MRNSTSVDLQIHLTGLGKQYRRWVFRDVNYIFALPHVYGISGPNGSGKSTLLKIISGYTSPTQGKVQFWDQGLDIPEGEWCSRLSFGAPYVALVGELTVIEQLRFHHRFKSFVSGLRPAEILERIQLDQHAHTMVDALSSGLMQRLKIGLALLSDVSVVLLDEPTSYLDQAGRDWFADLFKEHAKGRLVLLASNDPEDLALCETMVSVSDYAARAGQVVGGALDS